MTTFEIISILAGVAAIMGTCSGFVIWAISKLDSDVKIIANRLDQHMTAINQHVDSLNQRADSLNQIIIDMLKKQNNEKAQ